MPQPRAFLRSKAYQPINSQDDIDTDDLGDNRTPDKAVLRSRHAWTTSSSTVFPLVSRNSSTNTRKTLPLATPSALSNFATSVLTIINITLFWLLTFELLVKHSLLSISQEIWLNAVVRPPGIMLILLWGWAGALYVCRHYGLDVERCLVIDMDLAPFVSAVHTHHVVNTALAATVAFQLNFLSHLYNVLPAPRILIFVVLVTILTNPTTWLHDGRQFTIIQCLFTIANPFGQVTFREVLLADILTSLSKTLVDLQAIVCAFGFSTISSSNPLLFLPGAFDDCFQSFWSPFVMALPFVFRFRQCITRYRSTGDMTHIYNAVKYLSSLPVVVLSVMRSSDPSNKRIHNLFIIFAAVNSTYGFVWDCVFDWGLWRNDNTTPIITASTISTKPALPNSTITISMEKDNSEDMATTENLSPVEAVDTSLNKLETASTMEEGVGYFGLRGCIFFPPWVYYAVMVFDFALRFVWVLGFVPLFTGLGRELDLFVFEAVEVTRRCVWVVFRIEWEHLCVSLGGPGVLPVVVAIADDQL